MSDPYLAEYVICRLGKSGALEDEPLILSAEAACRREPARFVRLLTEMDRAWKAHYVAEKARRAQLPLGLEGIDTQA